VSKWILCMISIFAELACASVVRQPDVCATRPCTYTVTCAAAICTSQEVAEVQAAIDDAQPGDTIKLQAGKVFPISGVYGLMLKHKANVATGYITITTTEDSKLPDAKTRITPAYAPLLPTIMANAAPFPGIWAETGPRPAAHYKLVGLRFTSRGDANFTRGYVTVGSPSGQTKTFTADPATDVLTTSSDHHLDSGNYVYLYTTGTLPPPLATNTRYWARLVSTTALTLSETPGGPAINVTGAGSGTHTIIQHGVMNPSDQPDDIIVDRCLFQGVYDRNIRRLIGIHARNIVIKNSFLERAQDVNTDAQAIAGWNGTGPYIIENNYIDGATENVMFGGAIGENPNNPAAGDNRGVTAADITMRFNYLPKLPERYHFDPWAPAMYVELGKVVRATVSTNNRTYIATNSGVTGSVDPNWPTTPGDMVADGQVQWKTFGTTLNTHWHVKNNFELKAAERVLVEYNVFDRMWADAQQFALNFKTDNQPSNCNATSPTCYVARTEDVIFRNNIVRSAPVAWTGTRGPGIAKNWTIVNNLFSDIDTFAYGGGKDSQLRIINGPTGLSLEHNTIVGKAGYAGLYAEGSRDNSVIFRNNILTKGTTGVRGAGTGEGKDTYEAYLCASSSCPPSQINKNAIAGIQLSLYPNTHYNLCGNAGPCTPSFDRARFVNPADEDYTLASDSPLKGAATDGTDIGVDTTQLPQIRHLRVTAAAQQAVFSYDLTPPIRNIPCTVEVSTQRDLSSPIPDVNPVYFPGADSDRRATAVTDNLRHIVVVGKNVVEPGADGNTYDRALASSTTYYYRLMCGGDVRRGSFTTSAPANGTTQMNLPIRPIPGVATALVDYGYVEEGAPMTLPHSTEPVACDTGCTAQIPVVQGRITYYRTRYRDSSDVDAGSGPMQVIATP
jgi:hypothetical protein